MNAIEALRQDIERAVPGVEVKVRRPRNPDGNWWLDAKFAEHVVSVQWAPRRGFGVSASDLAGYGEGADEVFEDRERTAQRVITLLRTQDNTIPPRDVLLRELRALLGVTQDELAERLGVQQAAVSRLERRSDMTLGSLRRYVAALGGELEISIRTPGGEHVRLLAPDAPNRRASCAHVEQGLPALCASHAVPAHEELVGWLSAFEADARERWTLEPRPLTVSCASGKPLASTEPRRGHIAIDASTASRLALALSRYVAASADDNEAAAMSSRAVHRFLLAHEVGHLVGDALSTEPAFRQFQDPELKADAIAGWLAARQGDEAGPGTAVTRLLGCHTSNCTHPAPDARSMAYLTGYAQGAHDRRSTARMNLLVLRAGDIERSRSFYALLGLHLVPERHGTGPLHYSCRLAETVMEIYPGTGSHARGGLRLGIQLPRASAAIERLVAAGFLTEHPSVLRRQHRAEVYLVRDPDGNSIELELPAAA